MRFLLHMTHEGRPGLCHERDAGPVPLERHLCWLDLPQVVGLYDDIHETFQTCVDRGDLHQHPDDGGETED